MRGGMLMRPSLTKVFRHGPCELLTLKWLSAILAARTTVHNEILT